MTMPDAPPSIEDLTESVDDAITQWFKRNAHTTEAMIEGDADGEPRIELSASGHSYPHVILVGLTASVDSPRLSLEYEIRAQFRHPYSEPAPANMVAEFVRNTAAPMLLGMVRGAIATESAIFDLGKILLPYFVERRLRELPDSAFVEEQ